MLDTDTKRRIDTARDILVGKVPDPKSQVEQITISQKDIDICLGFDLAGIADRPEVDSIRMLHGVLQSEYGTDDEHGDS